MYQLSVSHFQNRVCFQSKKDVSSSIVRSDNVSMFVASKATF